MANVKWCSPSALVLPCSPELVCLMEKSMNLSYLSSLFPSPLRSPLSLTSFPISVINVSFRATSNKISWDWVLSQVLRPHYILITLTSSSSFLFYLLSFSILPPLSPTPSLSLVNSLIKGPNVKWLKQKRWVDAGSILTSAGVSAGKSLLLYLLLTLPLLLLFV